MTILALQQSIPVGGYFSPLSPNPAMSIDAAAPAAGAPGTPAPVPTPPP